MVETQLCCFNKKLKNISCETDGNGDAMLQSFLSKLFRKSNRLKMLSYRRYGDDGKKMNLFFRRSALIASVTDIFWWVALKF